MSAADELAEAVIPVFARVWDAVDGPSTRAEHDALIGLNNVVAEWLRKHYPESTERIRALRSGAAHRGETEQER